MIIDSYSGTQALVLRAFDGKTDLSGKPYLGHLIRVSNGVTNYTSRVVALLHDLLEDCPEWTEEKLRELYSDEVVEAVVCLTKLPDEPYDDYIQRVKTNSIAVDVKLSDLRDNMDMTRLPEISDKDMLRLRKYHKAYVELSKVNS